MENAKRLSARETVILFLRALKVSFTARSPATFVINLLGFAMAFLPVLISTSIRRFTDHIQLLSESGNGVVAPTLTAFAVLAALYIVQAVYNAVQEYFARTDSERIRGYIKETVIRNCCGVQYKYIDNCDDYIRKIDLIGLDVGIRVAETMQSTILWVYGLISFISILTVLTGVNTWIMLILLVSAIPSVIIETFQRESECKLLFSGNEDWTRINNLYSLAARPGLMKELRFWGLFPFVKNMWRKQNIKYIAQKNKLTRKYLIGMMGADILRNGAYIAVMLFAARGIFANPVLGLGTFMLVFTMSTQLQDVTAGLFERSVRFRSELEYMQIFFGLTDLEREATDGAPAPLEKMDIEFRNVDFTYPNAGFKALSGLSVKIKQGEKIAIVGENGSGKSTFVNLLCGFYEPQTGEVTVNGETLCEHAGAVRASLSAVFQDFAQYEDTIRENIVTSDRSRVATDEELADLCGLTGAYDFIKTQEQGFDEVLGSYSQSGNDLSGGQWQKIALTRALYREKTKMVILDEPTAALDPMAEAQIYRNFAPLTGDKTTILISHRLGVTSIVDRILVFHEGRIVEDGSHEELMKNAGHYAKMYTAQAQWYA